MGNVFDGDNLSEIENLHAFVDSLQPAERERVAEMLWSEPALWGPEEDPANLSPAAEEERETRDTPALSFSPPIASTERGIASGPGPEPSWEQEGDRAERLRAFADRMQEAPATTSDTGIGDTTWAVGANDVPSPSGVRRGGGQ